MLSALFCLADHLDPLDRIFRPGWGGGNGNGQQADPESGVADVTKRHCHLGTLACSDPMNPGMAAKARKCVWHLRDSAGLGGLKTRLSRRFRRNLS